MLQTPKRIGFIGLGNVGGKLAVSLIKQGKIVTVLDLNQTLVEKFTDMGAKSCQNPRELMTQCDAVITCLPSPRISDQVVDSGHDSLLSAPIKGKIWMEMSTTDESEVKRLGEKIAIQGGYAVDCPVSGGCHRAATGNISIFAGCDRPVFDAILPLLTTMGRRILHTGPIGSASLL